MVNKRGGANTQAERGCDAFMKKPYSMKELSQAIREIVDKK